MPKPDKPLKGHRQAARTYLKYSGLGIQMAAIITIFSLGGLYLDEYCQSKPLFVVIGSLSGVGLSLFSLLRQLLSENPKADQDRDDDL